MTNRTLLATVTALLSLSVSAQVTLDECKTSARDNYPAVKQYRLIELSRDYTMDNASKAWLPKVSVAAGAVAMTDIMENTVAGTAADVSNEIYGAMFQVNQTIYDGGTTAARKRVTRAEADVEKGRLDVTMYDINSRVEELFFGILTIDEKLKQIQLLQNDFELSMRTVNGMINGGLANQSDKDAIKVEQLKASQQESSLTTSRAAYVRMLAAFTGKDMSADTQFEKPETTTPAPETITNRRPELEYYSARLRLLDEQRHTLDTKLRPQISFFGAAVYHNRINDLLKNGTLAAGVTLSWNIGALYTRKNDIRNIETQKLQTESQRETFLLNTRMQNENSYGNINGLKKQIALDDEIITLRENIRQTTEKKVENGTETVNELLRHINAVSEARQTKAMHEIVLIRELYSLRHTNNI
jgi:outer membrane protein TolC